MKPAPSVHLPNSTERTMQYRHTMLYLLATLACSQAQAWSRMADARVHAINGQPCFTVSKKEEARNGTPLLGVLTVYDISSKPAEEAWSFIFHGTTTMPIHAKTCFLYGHAPAIAEATAAAKLKEGTMYSIFLNGRPDDAADSTYGYKGKFCITVTANGEQQVVPITREMPAWRDEICPAPSPLP